MHEKTHASSLSPQRPYKVSLTSSLPGEARTQRGAEPAEELPEAAVKDTGPVTVTSLPLNSCTQSALILNSGAISSSSFTQTFPIPTPLFSPPFLSLPCPSSQHPKPAVFSLSWPVTSHTKLEASSQSYQDLLLPDPKSMCFPTGTLLCR